MSELIDRQPQMLTVREGQMVFAVPSTQEGIDEIVYVMDENVNNDSGVPINLGGSLARLVDGDAMLEALDTIGRESFPSPPITSID